MEDQVQQIKTPLRRPVRTFQQFQEEKRERIKGWMATCMITVAILFDVISLVAPVITPVIAYFVYWVWFLILGVSFTKSPKKLASMGISAIIEVFFSFLPAFTAGIAATIFITRAEDKGGALGKVVSMAQGKLKP